MITSTASSWQAELAAAFRDPLELLEELALPPETSGATETTLRQFPMCVPRSFVRRMRKADPSDPLLRQVLPLRVEERASADDAKDPVGDLPAMRRPGVLHKYRGRVLLIATGACAIHCRYCFRRHFPYNAAHARAGRWQHALEYIASDDSVHEVILSGGDPLSLVDQMLAELVGKLAAIPHVQRLRLHTRLPVVLPGRVTASLLSWLTVTPLQVIVVVHVNHPNELDDEVRAALARLAGTGATLLNQAVLLRGVNDDAEALSGLSEALFSSGVLPYYLHQLDRVQGAAHFAVEDRRALALLETLRNRLPGYLVPRLVREEPGAASKVPLGW